MDIVSILIMTLALAAIWLTPPKHRLLAWITAAYAVAWAIVANKAPDLWTVALLGFIQNVAFTFVSRGRNSGSLGYHFVASIFSNGVYAALLFVSIDQVSQAKGNPGLFLTVYTLSTMSGSIFAHWLALRMERGKAKSVQEDKFSKLQRQVNDIEARLGVGPQCERLHESTMPDGRLVRAWIDIEENAKNRRDLQLAGLMKDPTNVDVPDYELARQFCERVQANAVQVSTGGKGGYVYYRNWP